MSDAIEIEVVYAVGDGEEIGVYAKGHHDPAAFAAAVETWLRDDESGGAYMGVDPEYVLPVRVDEVRHETWRDEECDDGDCAFIFRPAAPSDPGAYAVTCVAFDGGGLTTPAPESRPVSPPSEGAPSEGKETTRGE